MNMSSRCRQTQAPTSSNATFLHYMALLMAPKHRLVLAFHGACDAVVATVGCATGNRHLNMAPLAVFSAHSRPPCACTIDRLMDSPIPKPFGLVLKNMFGIAA